MLNRLSPQVEAGSVNIASSPVHFIQQEIDTKPHKPCAYSNGKFESHRNFLDTGCCKLENFNGRQELK